MWPVASIVDVCLIPHLVHVVTTKPSSVHVAFVVFVAVAMYIYHRLNIKSYYARIEPEFLTSVVKITESIDENGLDVNVAKVVSRVIAKDIKKDKIIKVKRKKKED